MAAAPLNPTHPTPFHLLIEPEIRDQDIERMLQRPAKEDAETARWFAQPAVLKYKKDHNTTLFIVLKSRGPLFLSHVIEACHSQESQDTLREALAQPLRAEHYQTLLGYAINKCNPITCEQVQQFMKAGATTCCADTIHWLHDFHWSQPHPQIRSTLLECFARDILQERANDQSWYFFIFANEAPPDLLDKWIADNIASLPQDVLCDILELCATRGRANLVPLIIKAASHAPLPVDREERILNLLVDDGFLGEAKKVLQGRSLPYLQAKEKDLEYVSQTPQYQAYAQRQPPQRVLNATHADQYNPTSQNIRHALSGERAQPIGAFQKNYFLK